jgi:RHS repeat-associated protein
VSAFSQSSKKSAASPFSGKAALQIPSSKKYKYDKLNRILSAGDTQKHLINNMPSKDLYDATGRKWLHHVEDKYTRRYAGGLTFEKADDSDEYVLEAANTGDGRIVFDAENVELYPEYHHKDHLGNVRVTFTDRNKDKLVEIIGDGNEVGQVMDFYPFGLQQEGEGVFGAMVGSSNRYRYNGKEFSEELGLYDYGARWYDPSIARWGQVDPHADSYPSLSPYNYVANNPINGIDPDGRDYILLFNHENQTVTVQATYYFERGDDDSWNELVGAASLWMDQSGKFSYTVGSGDEAIDYAVNFDFVISEVENPVSEASKDNATFEVEGAINPDGGSNAFEIAPDSDKRFINDNPNADTNGATSGGGLC